MITQDQIIEAKNAYILLCEVKLYELTGDPQYKYSADQLQKQLTQAERERDEWQTRHDICGWIAAGAILQPYHKIETVAQEDVQKLAAERDSLKEKLSKVSRIIDALEKINDGQTDMEAACSASLNEAILGDTLDAVEAERDNYRQQVGILRAALESFSEAAKESIPVHFINAWGNAQMALGKTEPVGSNIQKEQ